MVNKDTIHLLKECDAGTKMAISSIDEIAIFIPASHSFNSLIESSI